MPTLESLCQVYTPIMLVMRFIGYNHLDNLTQHIGKLFCYYSNVFL